MVIKEPFKPGGAFRLGKISDATGFKNANGTRGATGNFAEQTGNLAGYSTFFVPTTIL